MQTHLKVHFGSITTLRALLGYTQLALIVNGCADTQEPSGDALGVAQAQITAGSGALTSASSPKATGQGAGLMEATQVYSFCWLCPPGEDPSSGNCTRATQNVCDDAPNPPPPPPPTKDLHDDCRLETLCGEDPHTQFNQCLFGFCLDCVPFATCIDPNSRMNGQPIQCPDAPCMMP
jgi:hypothetical protein